MVAAVTGVFLHGGAGDEAASRLGDAGVLASDLLPLIPLVIRELRPFVSKSK
jgi:NAD(P)H-hydrate repair Nnr-like enzyme with NAD(P)H-hydrate dehydratase domain